MELVSEGQEDEWWGTFQPGKSFRYGFWLADKPYRGGQAGPMLDRSGVHDSNAPDYFQQDLGSFPLPSIPGWAESAILYEILPDRFDNDKGDLAVSGVPGDEKWLGGTLRGIAKHADYFKTLGVNGVCVGSIFQASDPFGLKVTDFGKVDSHFGAADDLGDLSSALHREDIRLAFESPRSVSDSATSLTKSLDLDGWVMNPLGDQSPWSDVRAWVKKAHPKSLLIADAGSTPNLLQGDGPDSLIDREWRQDVLGFLKDKEVKPSHLEKELRGFRDRCPDGAIDSVVHAISSFGTDRIKSFMGTDKDRIRQAWAFQFTYPGVPMIYYGDEIGLMGKAGAEAHGAMVWNDGLQDKDMLTFAESLTALRNQRPSLRHGSYQTLLADDQTHLFGFVRVEGFERTVIIFNNGDDLEDVRIPAPQFGNVSPTDLLSTASFSVGNATIDVSVKPHSFVVMGTPTQPQ